MSFVPELLANKWNQVFVREGNERDFIRPRTIANIIGVRVLLENEVGVLYVEKYNMGEGMRGKGVMRCHLP